VKITQDIGQNIWKNSAKALISSRRAACLIPAEKLFYLLFHRKKAKL
jgi:hypothetical protein